MFHPLSPLGLWCNAMQFWAQCARLQADSMRRMMHLPLSPEADPDPAVRALCAAAARPARSGHADLPAAQGSDTAPGKARPARAPVQRRAAQPNPTASPAP